MAPELKIVRASFLGSRTSASSSFERGRPNRDRRAFDQTSANPERGSVAASLAVSIPVPVYRKYGECGRSTRTRRSPILRPWSGRRPPIMRRLTLEGRGQRSRDGRGQGYGYTTPPRRREQRLLSVAALQPCHEPGREPDGAH